MNYLFDAPGLAALAALSGNDVLGFDFDGTLAPIAADPALVQLAGPVLRDFTQLCASRRVAVITGRGISEVLPRLGAKPEWLVGNHGAEGLPGRDDEALDALARTCAAWRDQLASQPAWIERDGGVWLEDKVYSLCLHYRQAADHAAVRDLLFPLVRALEPPPICLPGKCTLNLLGAGATDKYGALAQLVQACGAASAFFIGDDTTDETVFQQAPPHWVTVKVGNAETSRARFFLHQQHEIGRCLQLLLRGAA